MNLARRFVLIDSCPVTVERVKTLDPHRTVYKRDLFVDPVPTLDAAAVVADPPWYDEHIEAFLWA
jgi:FMN-dependent NADH-azoreductase